MLGTLTSNAIGFKEKRRHLQVKGRQQMNEIEERNVRLEAEVRAYQRRLDEEGKRAADAEGKVEELEAEIEEYKKELEEANNNLDEIRGMVDRAWKSITKV